MTNNCLIIQNWFVDEPLSSRLRESPLDTARYASKIIKASALLSDTKMLLAHWDECADVLTNLDRMRQDNVFGKGYSPK